LTVGFKETQAKVTHVPREASDHDAVSIMLDPE
jgi:hypothetical protein